MALKPEQIDHINTINWFEHNFPEYADDFHHFANERFVDVKKNPEQWQTVKTLKRMGVKKGVLDFHLALPCGGYHGLWLELKVGKGKLLPEQVAFIDRKNARGYLALAVWGFDAAKEIILTYLKDYNTERSQNILKTQYNFKPNC